MSSTMGAAVLIRGDVEGEFEVDVPSTMCAAVRIRVYVYNVVCGHLVIKLRSSIRSSSVLFSSSWSSVG